MIRDKQLLLSSGQTIVDSGASTEYVDTLAAGDAISPGARIKVSVKTVYARAAGDFTITVSLRTDADVGFGTDTVLISGPAVAKAALVAGANLLDAVIPVGVLRYLRVYYTFSAAADSGAVNAAIVLDTDKTMDKIL